MKWLCVIFVLTLLWSYTQTCITPLGATSECISLYNCPQLLAALEQRPLRSQVVNFLKQSQCGFEGHTPRVCCGPLPAPVQDEPVTVASPSPTWPSTDVGNQVDMVSSEDSSLAPRDICGVDYPDRIYGGQIVDLDEFTWMALLGYRTRNGSLRYECGGVLINRRYVLTAAHCVTGQVLRDVGSLVTVRLGEYDTQQDVDCLNNVCAERPQEIPVQAGYPHSGFSEKNTNRRNDIALIRLARRVTYTYYVQPICLEDTSARLDVGNTVYVAGWGKTLNGRNSPVKLKLSMPVFDKNQCIDKYRPLGAVLTDKQLCAGGVFAQDACRGDSGGPLMRRGNQGVWEAVGVVSFGTGCGRDGWPGVYTSVGRYEDWIRSTLRSTNV